MKRLTLGLLVLTILGAAPTQADTYKIDASHSAIDFSIPHLVSKTNGTFGVFSGSITYDAGQPEKSQFEGVIDVASIDTQNSRRDSHLLSTDFFDAATHPTIEFSSTQVEKASDGSLYVTGELSMHGVTKLVTVPVEILGTGTHPMSGRPQIGLAGELTIKASDFGINNWENFEAILGDEVEIRILVEANAG